MKQREMPVMGDVKPKDNPVPPHLIEACKSKQESISLCIKWSGIQPTVIAELMEIDKGNFSRMMTGSAHFPPNKENALQDICGNEAILEWSCWSRNKKPIEIDNSARIAVLEAELHAMRRTA